MTKQTKQTITLTRRDGTVIAEVKAGSVREACEKQRPCLAFANLYCADLGSADLTAANLYCADLGSANLRGANLTAANLYGANLRDAYLRDADLHCANLGFANLTAANLYAANLRDAYLRDANLRAAYLGSANLRDANLYGANLRGANLYDANLRNARLNWMSHDLIAELLLRAAGNDIAKRKLAGLVLISPFWCWKNFLVRLADDPLLPWALDVLAEYVTDGDNAPEELRDLKSKEGK